jgi:hypothetical protein
MANSPEPSMIYRDGAVSIGFWIHAASRRGTDFYCDGLVNWFRLQGGIDHRGQHFMILIIWSGLGFLVAVIAFGCSLIANLIFNAAMGEGYYDHHKWPCAVSLMVSAMICWFLGDYLRKRPGRVVIDKQTGKEFTLNKKHTLFLIPVHYWSPILLGGALILFVMEFVH